MAKEREGGIEGWIFFFIPIKNIIFAYFRFMLETIIDSFKEIFFNNQGNKKKSSQNTAANSRTKSSQNKTANSRTKSSKKNS